jgi:hypothetical protein
LGRGESSGRAGGKGKESKLHGDNYYSFRWDVNTNFDDGKAATLNLLPPRPGFLALFLSDLHREFNAAVRQRTRQDTSSKFNKDSGISSCQHS